MAERFVVGFMLDVQELLAVPGSGGDSTRVIAATQSTEEVDELLAEWAPDDPLTAEEAVRAILSLELDPTRAYEYRRALELVADGVGERFEEEIEVVCTYYMPNDTPGRWTPALKALGLEKLATAWGTNNSPFPWKDGESRVDWPIATLLDAATTKLITAEFAALPPSAVAALPASLFSKKEDDPEARQELSEGLETLENWCSNATSSGRGLLIWMDGSQ